MTLISTIKLSVKTGGVTKWVKFDIIDASAIYNTIIGTSWIHKIKAVQSIYHQCVKFSAPKGTFTLQGNQQTARACFVTKRKVCLDKDHPKLCVVIGTEFPVTFKDKLVNLLSQNIGTFVWSMANMKGIDPHIISHKLDIDPTFKPIKQKRRKLGQERAQAVNDKVEKLLGAQSIKKVKYLDWLAI